MKSASADSAIPDRVLGLFEPWVEPSVEADPKDSLRALGYSYNPLRSFTGRTQPAEVGDQSLAGAARARDVRRCRWISAGHPRRRSAEPRWNRGLGDDDRAGARGGRGFFDHPVPTTHGRRNPKKHRQHPGQGAGGGTDSTVVRRHLVQPRRTQIESRVEQDCDRHHERDCEKAASITQNAAACRR